MMKRSWRLVAAVLVGYAALAGALYLTFTSRQSYLPDFYVEWVATRVALAGGNPYSLATTQLIQETMLGHLVSDGTDQMAFAAPYYRVLLNLPIAFLPYRVASTLWLTWSFFWLIAGIGLCVDAAGWTPRPWQFALLVAAGIFTLPSFGSLMLGQTATMVFGLLALTLWAQTRGHLALAGTALAFATVKPQMAILVVPIMLIWWAVHRQWRGIVAFAATGIVLAGASTLLYPPWLGEFFAAMQRYPTYKDVRTGPQYLMDNLGPFGQLLGWVLWAAVAGWLVLAWRRAMRRGSQALVLAYELTLAATCFLPPQTNIIHPLLCLPAAVSSIRLISTATLPGRAAWILGCIVVAALPWAIYLTLWPSRYDLVIALTPAVVLVALALRSAWTLHTASDSSQPIPLARTGAQT